MKKTTILTIVFLLFFWCLPHFLGLVWAGQGDKKQWKQKKKGARYERVYRQDHPTHHPRGKRYKHYNKRHHNRYKNHHYKGHYNWRQWNKQRRNDRYRWGRYHHDDNGYLMFSFCNNEKGQRQCFSISID